MANDGVERREAAVRVDDVLRAPPARFRPQTDRPQEANLLELDALTVEAIRRAVVAGRLRVHARLNPRAASGLLRAANLHSGISKLALIRLCEVEAKMRGEEK